jgi:hypothetical protein
MEYRFEMISLANVGRTLSGKGLRFFDKVVSLPYNRVAKGVANPNLENPIA